MQQIELFTLVTLDKHCMLSPSSAASHTLYKHCTSQNPDLPLQQTGPGLGPSLNEKPVVSCQCKCPSVTSATYDAECHSCTLLHLRGVYCIAILDDTVVWHSIKYIRCTADFKLNMLGLNYTIVLLLCISPSLMCYMNSQSFCSLYVFLIYSLCNKMPFGRISWRSQ